MGSLNRKLGCLGQETILFLQTLQQWISSLPLQINPFKKIWLCYLIYNMHNVPFFKTRHTFSFFPSIITELSKGDHNIRIYSSFSICRKSILKFIIPSAKSFFDSYNPKGIKFITRLQLSLSHLPENKFKHEFQDSLNPFCKCGLDTESTTH